MGGGRILLVVLGALLSLLALAVLAAGGALLWLHATQRDDDGFYSTPDERFETEAYALTSQGFDIASEVNEDVPDFLLEEGRLATVRLRATPAAGGEAFVGIGPEDDVRAYLDGVAYDEVEDVDVDPFEAQYRRVEGDAEPEPPGAQAFWVASAEGPGRQTVEWPIEEGRWAIVVMNADASQGVAVDLDIGAKVGFVLWIAIGLLVAGALLLGLGALMIALGIRGGAPAAPPPVVPAPVPEPAAEAEAAEPYVVAVEGVRDAELNRWLPLVKWILVLPHAVVLAFLWIAFFGLTVVAGFAILFTERYPRALFDFNVGVLRWTWRVLFYSYGALGTDRYPPFTLGHAADYPATLDVPYPERLSRGLVLVKWWLLAIPHYLVVGVLVGTGYWWWDDGGWGAGLIGALALVAAGGLVLFGRYPRDVFELLVGANRWAFRVAAYAGLMRDEYPPFRLRR